MRTSPRLVVSHAEVSPQAFVRTHASIVPGREECRNSCSPSAFRRWLLCRLFSSVGAEPAGIAGWRRQPTLGPGPDRGPPLSRVLHAPRWPLPGLQPCLCGVSRPGPREEIIGRTVHELLPRERAESRKTSRGRHLIRRPTSQTPKPRAECSPSRCPRGLPVARSWISADTRPAASGRRYSLCHIDGAYRRRLFWRPLVDACLAVINATPPTAGRCAAPGASCQFHTSGDYAWVR